MNKKNLSQIIVGNGEVGSALREILACDFLDLVNQQISRERYDVMHICFPYKDERFITAAQDYQARFQPSLTIIHSTVAIGTSRKLGAVHSPIRGVHPNMAQGIRTFVKYFGGEQAADAAKIFEDLGIKTRTFDRADTTEAIKLWDTTQYGYMIMLEKEIYDWCQQQHLDYDAIYHIANQDYNDGYMKLNRAEVMRPHLQHMDGPIGGHCVIPNAFLLDGAIARELINFNRQLEKTTVQ